MYTPYKNTTLKQNPLYNGNDPNPHLNSTKSPPFYSVFGSSNSNSNVGSNFNNGSGLYQSISNVNAEMMNNSDLSEFLKNDTIIVSDLEGTAPTKLLNEIMESDKQVLYLGDLCDYTYYEPNISKNLKAENLCMLRLMKHFVDKQNSEHGATRWILGNRDLNKIKLRHLLRFSNNSTYWKETDNNEPKYIPYNPNNPYIPYNPIIQKHTDNLHSTLTLNLDTVLQLAIKLIDNNTKDKNKSTKQYIPLWAVNNDDFKMYSPFWNSGNDVYLEKWIKNKLTTDTLYKRFLLIFGRDPNEGTMSAGNTLNKLPEEYGFSMDKLNETAKSKNVDLNELLSALVFIIYMRLLDKDLYHKYETDDTCNKYDGCLYYYLVNGACANYAYSNNDLYLFSHAGLTMDFFKNNNLITPEAFNILANLSKKDWTNIKNPYSKLKGGAINTKVDDIIKKFNETVSKKIKYILDKDSNLHGDIIYYLIQGLLAISTSAYQNPNLTELRHLSPVCLLPKDSPIKEDLSSLNKLGSVVNVFGHTTKGFGYTFSKVKKEHLIPFNTSNNISVKRHLTDTGHLMPFNTSQFINKGYSVPFNTTKYVVPELTSYVITTDFSNGIMKSDLLYQKHYNNNNLLLTMKLGTEKPFHLHGSLTFSDKLTKSSIHYNEYSNPKTINILDKSAFISNIDTINNVKKLNYDYRFNLTNFMYDPQCLFNGIGSINTAVTSNLNNNEFSTPNNKMNIYSLLKSDQDKLLILESSTQSAGTRKTRKARKTRKTRKHRKARTIRRNRK